MAAPKPQPVVVLPDKHGDGPGKISHPDFTIVKRTPNDLTDGKKILVDVTITGPNIQNRQKAQIMVGAMSKAAEERKIQQVNGRWHVKHKPGVQFVPFAIENTGGLGAQARELVYEMLDIPKPPPPDAQGVDAANKRIERTEKFEALWRIKATIAAAVWKGNHFIYTEYNRSLKAVIPPPGGHLIEEE